MQDGKQEIITYLRLFFDIKNIKYVKEMVIANAEDEIKRNFGQRMINDAYQASRGDNPYPKPWDKK